MIDSAYSLNDVELHFSATNYSDAEIMNRVLFQWSICASKGET